MITSLLSRSAVRGELLSLVFANPERRYYQRQLEKRLGRPVSAIRRELLRLEAEGLLLRSREANVVLFQANRGHPLFAEVSSIVAKTVGIPAWTRKALLKVHRIKFAGIFGSYSRYLARERGVQWRADSDIDLLVVGEAGLGEVARALRPLEARFQRSINPTIYTPAEWAVRLGRGDDFLRDVFRHPIIPLIGWCESEILGPQRIDPLKLEEKRRGSEGGRRPRRR